MEEDAEPERKEKGGRPLWGSAVVSEGGECERTWEDLGLMLGR